MISPLELLIMAGVVGMAFGPKKWKTVFALIFIATLAVSYLGGRV